MAFSVTEQANIWGIEQTKWMPDAFIAPGFNFFDTAHGYIDKKSELVAKRFDAHGYNDEDQR